MSVSCEFAAVRPLQRTGSCLTLRENDARVNTIHDWAQDLEVPLTLLGIRHLRPLFPNFSIPRHTIGFWEKDAGLIRVEALIEAMILWAESRGVSQHYGEEVQNGSQGATLITSQHSIIMRVELL